MILKNSLRAKAGVPKALVKQNIRLHSLISLRTRLCSRGESSDLRCIFRPVLERFPTELHCKLTHSNSHFSMPHNY